MSKPLVENTHKERAKSQIAALFGHLPSLTQSPIPASVSKVLEDFELFANEYHAYVAKDMLQDAKSAYDLNRSINKIQNEYVTLSLACSQYMLPQFQDALNEANGRILDYYTAFKGYKTAAMPIVFFEKVFGISRFVFTSHPLVSIPFRYINHPARWTALAHELGHFIYWNSCGITKYNAVQQNLRNRVIQVLSAFPLPASFNAAQIEEVQFFLVNIWLNWLEETFADICGTLFAGVNYLESTMQRSIEETGLEAPRLLYSDGEHPAHYLRPLIAMETLSWVATKTSTSISSAINEQVSASYNRWTAEFKIVVDASEVDWASVLEDAFDSPEVVSEVIKEVLRELVRSVKQVVTTILEGYDDKPSWVKPAQSYSGNETASYTDTQPANLGELIEYSIWFEQLGLETKPSSDGLSDLLKHPAPQTFNQVLTALKHKEPSQIVEALLELEFSDTDYDDIAKKKRKVVGDARLCSGASTYRRDDVNGTSRCTIGACVKGGTQLYKAASGCS
jgi:hypothetical protein